MKKFSISALITAAVLLSSTANAQYRPDYRDRDRDRYRDERNDGPGLIRAVQSDLQRLVSWGQLRGRDRQRLDRALGDLDNFDRDLSRGRFDRHDLDRAIDHVKDVVGHVPPGFRERDILIRDVERLRAFRDRGGFAPPPPGGYYRR